MYGASIEKDFQHGEFETQQLQRKMAARRQFDVGQQYRERSRRSLVDLFGQFVDRLDPRVPTQRSTVTPS